MIVTSVIFHSSGVNVLCNASVGIEKFSYNVSAHICCSELAIMSHFSLLENVLIFEWKHKIEANKNILMNQLL